MTVGGRPKVEGGRFSFNLRPSTFHLVPFSIGILLSLFALQNTAAAQPNVSVTTYDQLLHAIRETRNASQARIETAVEQEKVREAWETGKLIDEHILLHKERAEYDKEILIKLARDLGTSKTELYYALGFARAYPIFPAPGKLSWAHYRELLSVKDSEKRKMITQEAETKGWSQKKLRKEIKERKLPLSSPNDSIGDLKLPETQPGSLYAYRVVKASVGPYKGQLAVDLGFSSYFMPKEIRKFKENDLVILEKGKLKPFKGAGDARYTYNATVTQVIDGDSVPRKTAQAMRAGPSEPTYGSRFQSPLSGFG